MGIVGPGPRGVTCAGPPSRSVRGLGRGTAWGPPVAGVGLFVPRPQRAARAARLCAAQLTRNAWLRGLAALVWTLAPTLPIALR